METNPSKSMDFPASLHSGPIASRRHLRHPRRSAVRVWGTQLGTWGESSSVHKLPLGWQFGSFLEIPLINLEGLDPFDFQRNQFSVGKWKTKFGWPFQNRRLWIQPSTEVLAIRGRMDLGWTSWDTLPLATAGNQKLHLQQKIRNDTDTGGDCYLESIPNHFFFLKCQYTSMIQNYSKLCASWKTTGWFDHFPAWILARKDFVSLWSYSPRRSLS